MTYRIAISGLWYEVCMMRYFLEGFQELQKERDDLEIWTCGPFFGNWIPWGGGMTLPQKYVYTPNFPLPKQAAQAFLHPQMIIDGTPKNIDLWLQIDAGWHFSSRPNAKVVGLIETDPHCLKEQYKLPKSYSDITWCMQTPYMENDEIFLPYGVPQKWFYPIENVEIQYDACLIGLHYQHRDALIETLKRKGRKVYYNIGKIYDEFASLYSQSTLAISWSSLKDLPVRVFEAMGMAVPLLTNRVPDLEKLFIEGKHYLGFSSLDEAIEQVEWMLDYNQENFLEKMRWNSHKEVMAKHLFTHRCQQILDDVERMH